MLLGRVHIITFAVYVIDAVDTEELDEPVQSETDTAWVHIHIADPTSVLPPTHVFAPQAREQWSLRISVIERGHCPLNLSCEICLVALVPQLRQVSLSLSFSYKVDSTPDIVDYKVRAGIVRKVIHTTYEAVDRALGLPPVFSRYPFGGGPPLHTEPVGLDEHQLADIYALAHTIGCVH